LWQYGILELLWQYGILELFWQYGIFELFWQYGILELFWQYGILELFWQYGIFLFFILFFLKIVLFSWCQAPLSSLTQTCGFGFMVFNTTFNNISLISWQSVLLVEETRVLGANHRPAVSHWQTLSDNVVSSTPR
jgi:hypothetical protein